MQDQIRIRLAPTYPFKLSAANMSGGSVEVQLRLCLDFAAFGLIKQRTGLEMWRDGQAWARLVDSDVLPVVFWAACRRHHPDLRGEEALDILSSYIDPSTADEVASAVFEAYLAVLPKEIATRMRAAVEDAKRQDEPADPPEPPAAKQ